MAKCVRCNVTITDETMVCPLCNQILEPIEGEVTKNVYPNIRAVQKKINLALRLYIFLAAITEALLIYINIKTDSKIMWSAITGFAFLYALITIIFTINRAIGLKLKMANHVLWAVVFVIGIDYAIGYRGWSLSFVLPGGIVAMDVILLILILTHRKHYQDYIPMELMILAVSFLPLILYFQNIASVIQSCVIPIIASALLFLGTVVIGGARSNAELSRRFHI